MSDDIPVSFEFKGMKYSGSFALVHGGGTKVWHLTINKYHCGRLRLTDDEWIFDTNSRSMGWEALADYFGTVVLPQK